ncbi:hypothetical protein L198_04668 [Cryptococcus wingfieldii CBS 7118]|uniref:F-box domain-containing protein n=1 Tax=Cryptococcus wingfieldii CBS 7118 TaxID=1295528 RepID=A0A1E3J355_9TREE|nr:hypothetical protein L198_04668 [Cryptococcus wingfieldii CBS 7118]ODN95277.1 hypothetical protein L198_04668 [Cryptococcus wingfieldii CBS 7118]
MASMIERLMGKGPQSSDSSPYRPRREPLPYEVPDPNGVAWLLRLPDELFEKVFENIDRATFVRCHRVCSQINDFLSGNASMKLQNLLQTASLHLNPNALKPNTSNPHLVPPSRAFLLDQLRERLTRFRTFEHKEPETVKFEEREGRLYEFLEGILMRSIPPPDANPWTRAIGREMGVYEFDKMREWEDVKDGDEQDDSSVVESDVVDVEEQEEYGQFRRVTKLDFDMLDFTFDPGQDLFVAAQFVIYKAGDNPYISSKPGFQDPGNVPTSMILLHLLTISTFQPHPKAKDPVIVWPGISLKTQAPSMGFQICDDGLYVMRNQSTGFGGRDMLCGWQWTTGRHAVTLTASNASTFESFVMLSPSSFAIPSVKTAIRQEADIVDTMPSHTDLLFTHHLHIYAFPPLSSATFKAGEPVPPPHTATHVTTIDMPEFVVDFDDQIPPPRMTIRADPPPRYTFPTYPLANPQPFVPDPESGVFIIEFYCQPYSEVPIHYVMFIMRKMLLQYLPAPTSPLLYQTFTRPAPVVPFSKIAPKCRLLGPHQKVPSWVCYVYQDRYVTKEEIPIGNKLLLYDFNPLRVRQALQDPNIAVQLQSGALEVMNQETVIEAHKDYEFSVLAEKTVTGKELPCLVTKHKPVFEGEDDEVDTIIIDQERIIVFDDAEEEEARYMRVMEF